MTLPELHPDELLAREAASTLTPREWTDLSAHLARCPACALERTVRREAARVRAPSDLDHAIAARVLGRLMTGQDREPPPAKRSGLSGRGRRLAYAALVLLLVSGTATAGVALVVQIRHRQPAGVETEVRRTPRARVAAPKRPRAAATAVIAPGASAAEEAIAAEIGPPETAPAAAEPAAPSPTSGAAVPPANSVAHGAASGRVTTATSRLRSSRARAQPDTALDERSGVDAATLLSQAAAAESAGRTATASRLYLELGRLFPGTREEVAARALHAQLSLDRLGNPAQALALFERYLAAQPTGTLAEEARLGRARALERLGRTTDERAAWVELLRAHPRSVHAAAARTRLAALGAP